MTTQPAETSPLTIDPNVASTPATREEVFIGLIGAIGTDLAAVDKILTGLLQRDYEYACDTIKVSDRIRTVPAYEPLERRHAYEYYTRMIEGGNLICQELADKAALADMSIERIQQLRNEKQTKKRLAFVINSLKRPDEVRRLREVYGQNFYAIGTFADEDTRLNRLTRKINADSGQPNDAEGAYNAQRLVRRDEREVAEWGQKVSDTFAQADFFVRGDEPSACSTPLERFLKLVFDHPYESPTLGEVAMMHAYAAALRSADMSRQIGAAIVARDGRILTTGCNEVPKAGGGQYWASDKTDVRDWKIGQDMNDLKKRDAIVELLRQLDSVLLPEQCLDGVDILYDKIMEKQLLSGTRVDALLEFGRPLHAEMSALNGALLEAISVRDADLYCTTFPCHLCTRLIVGAGIRNVFYIEPYPKSVALELYGRHEIRVNPTLTAEAYDDRVFGDRVCDKRTYYLPFEGIAPRRYIDLFAKGKRKEADGAVLGFDSATSKPRRTRKYIATHLAAEDYVATSIRQRAGALRKGTSDAHATPSRQPENSNP